MTESTFLCLRCEGELEAGILLDRTVTGGSAVTHTSGGAQSLVWADAEHLEEFTKVRVDGVRQIEVDAYLCVDCGRIELYAGMGKNTR